MELLQEVVRHEDRFSGLPVPGDHPDARPVGMSYDQILERLREEFPGRRTTRACLRWYVNRVNEGAPGFEGVALPARRPRANSRRPWPTRRELEASLAELGRALRGGDPARVARARARVREVRRMLGG